MELILTGTPAHEFLSRFYHQLPARPRVILAQLPFFLTVALAAILIAVWHPEVLADPRTAAALVLNTVLMAVCVAVPWAKVPPAGVLVIPYLDFLVVMFFREGVQSLLVSGGMLALFPIFWLCASGSAPKTAVLSSTLASLAVVWNPLFFSGQMSADALVRPLLFPFVMLAFSIMVVVVTASMGGQRDALLAKDAELRAALLESQHREQLLDTVLDTVSVGVMVVDADGNDKLMNATQKAMHTWGQPQDNAHPNESELLLFSSDRAPLPNEWRPVHRAINGESFTNYQIWIGTGEHAHALSITARTIQYDDDSSDGAVIAFHDVTDMVNALAAKDDFVANVSHEFRTPLTAIQSYISLALEAPDLQPRDIAQYLTIAERNAERLGRLVSDLLATAAITVERAPGNMVQLVADCATSAAPAAAANAVIVDVQCQEPLQAMVDGGRISQVLDNLVSNAVKYSPDGGPVTVRAWADGTDLHCEVQDTGLGMSAAEQAGVFQKFFRAKTAVGRGIPGIGLGLMISKTIIENHGGSMSMESQQDVGTTMGFVIPACVMVTDALPVP